jgi:ABC-type sugar transport system substrate-binding protein
MSTSFTRLPALTFVGLLCAAASAASSAFAAALDRAVAFVFAAVAAPFNITQRFGTAETMSGRQPVYDGPAVHGLRHEAGVGRYAAARNT